MDWVVGNGVTSLDDDVVTFVGIILYILLAIEKKTKSWNEMLKITQLVSNRTCA